MDDPLFPAMGSVEGLGRTDASVDLAGILNRLVADPTRVTELPAESLPHLLGLLRSIELAVWARALTAGPSSSGQVEEKSTPDVWLTADEAATRLKRTRTWVYRQARHWKFAKRPSRKTLLISERGLTRWLEHR